MGQISELRAIIHLTLSKYFKSEKRLEEATDDMLGKVSSFIATGQAPKAPKGATVMTEAASANIRLKPEQV